MTSVLPVKNLVISALATTPPQAAKFVLIKILAIAVASSTVPRASCDPPLNPNHPNHNINTPTVANGTDEFANPGIGLSDLVANLPSLGPRTIAPAKAAAAPVA